MNWSSALRWIAILLIPLTVGWKLKAGSGEDPTNLRRPVTAFLKGQGLSVSPDDRMILRDLSAIHASTVACQIDVIEASPDGWNRDVIRAATRSADQAFFVYQGKIYDEQPVWRTVSFHLWSRFLRKLGLNSREVPAIVVAATGPCGARDFAWRNLLEGDASVGDPSSPSRK